MVELVVSGASTISDTGARGSPQPPATSPTTTAKMAVALRMGDDRNPKDAAPSCQGGKVAGMDQGYSTRDVCDATDVTFRCVDHWCRMGLVQSSLGGANGSGSRRRFSWRDMATVALIGQVSGLVAPSLLGQLAGYLDDLPLRKWAATRLVIDRTGGVWLSDAEDAPKVGVFVDLSVVLDLVPA